MKHLLKLLLCLMAACRLNGGELPGWSPAGRDAGCVPCGAAAPDVLDAATLLLIDLGPGERTATVGALAVRAESPDPALATPLGLELSGDLINGATETAEIDVRYDIDGSVRQVATHRVFVNVTATGSYSYTVRVMKKEAQGALSNGFYLWSTNPAHLIREFTVENPDASPTVYHRLRIRDVTSGTVEWMFTHTVTNSGWNVALPGGSGSIDLVTTNHAANAWTTIRRHRAPGGQVVAQHSQVFSNLVWGPVLLSDAQGVGTEARTRRWSYFEATNGLPFLPTPSLPAVKTVVEPDGSWRTVLTYDAQGRVLSELNGIDTAPTNTASLCRQVDYSYAPQAAGDDGSRESRSPRKVDESWKGTLVARTYHVYTDTFHRTVACPNPANAIGNAENLVTETTYDSGTTRAVKVAHRDGTITLPQTTFAPDGTATLVTFTGAPDGFGTAVLDGMKTEVVTGPAGTLVSRKTWAVAAGSVGPLVSSQLHSDFDAFDRPQRVDHLNGRYETMSYACCGLDSHTDQDGVTTSFDYDVLGRQDLVTRLGIAQERVFDAAGRLVVERRIGTDSSMVVQRQVLYDTSGFTVRETNALNGVIICLRTNTAAGYDQITTTMPDLGTKVETMDGTGLVRLTGTAVAPFRIVRGLTTTTYNGVSRTFQSAQEIRLDALGSDTSEVITQCEDGLGRTVKTILPGSVAAYSYFNSKGQRVQDVDPDGVTQLYRYNTQGALEVAALDLNGDGFVANFDAGYSGKDRVTRTTVSHLAAGAGGNTRGTAIRRTETLVWTTDSAATTAKVSTEDASLDGLKRWSVIYKDQATPVTTATETVYGAGGSRTVTTTASDASSVVTQLANGRRTSVTQRNSGGVQVAQVAYDYDPQGREWKVTDARNGTTTFAYNAADLVMTVSSPPPGTGQAAPATSTGYDASLRPITATEADGMVVNREYYSTGALKKSWGGRSYPVEYTYDAQGRMKTLKTWQGYAGGTGVATTTWNYDGARGWLTNKLHHGQALGTEYTYTAGGRLKTRKWARTGTGGQRVTTTYTYGFDDGSSGNDHPDLLQAAYANDPAATPTVTHGYDRRGRRTSSGFNGTTTALGYNDAGLPTSEGYTGGTLGGRTVTFGFDGHLRRNAVSANTPTALSQSYAYDTASRLLTVTDGAYSATYAYHPNSSLVSSVTGKQGATTRLTVSHQHDRLNRLHEIRSAPAASGQSPVSYTYQYNDAGQRTRASLADGSHWIYGYDALGQVTSGKRYWPDGTPVAGQQFEYAFDDVGNRTQGRAGGDQNGAGLQTSAYSANLLNQYTQRTVPAAAQVLGLAEAAATVTVNGQGAYRRGEYFWKEIPVANGSLPVWQSLAVQAVNGAGSSSSSGSQFVPKTPEVFTHDLDGNLTADGRWTYIWDAENRLVRMVAATAVGPQQRLDFEYDVNGRRIRKKMWNNTAGSGAAALDVKFVYDGWNLLAELNALASDAVVRTYVWGLDLSGSLQGAGGVGGLLAVKNAAGTAHFAGYDGNGNVALLVDGATGAASAAYEHGPFGEPLRATGPLARQNPFRFSTKFTDEETGLLYYGFRYYQPATGRWLGRDPIEELGGLNLYGFTENDPLSAFDILGKKTEMIKVLGANWKFKSNKLLPPKKKIRGNVTGTTTYGRYPLDAFVSDSGCEKGKKQLRSKGTTYKVDYWYTDKASQEYEEANVGILRDNWRTYGGSVDALAGCVCPPCADCRLDLAGLFQQFYTAWSTVELLEREILIQGITSLQPVYAAMVQARDKLQNDIDAKTQECAKKCN